MYIEQFSKCNTIDCSKKKKSAHASMPHGRRFFFAVIVKNELSALIDHKKLLVEKPALTFYTNESGIDNHIETATVNIYADNQTAIQSKGIFKSGPCVRVLLMLCILMGVNVSV